jgi:hypothetical protein
MTKTRRTSRTDRARKTFIATLAEFCNVSEAAREAGIGRTTAYEWREADPEFAAAWDAAEQVAADKLEREAWRRAVEGVDKPIYYQGDKIDTCKEYSDRMLEILLKGHRPEKFVDRIKAEHSGSVPVTFNFIRQAEAPDAS